MPHSASVGIDFGTTNSSVARVSDTGSVDLVRFSNDSPSFRSLLYLEQHRIGSRRATQSFTGPEAIARYLARHTHAEDSPGRLIQSLKSYLSVRSLTGTEVFGRHYTLEDLIARILADLRRAAEAYFGHPVSHATVGRPVRFVGADDSEDDLFAQERLATAFQTAGFDEVRFELEPIAAAFSYQSTLTRDELILIGDFGGGTSDFCLLHAGPTWRARAHSPEKGPGRQILGTAGVPLAGDSFDARIVRYLVSPALGADALVSTLGGSPVPAVPAWIYSNLERWHYLSFLRTRAVDDLLRRAHQRALNQLKCTSAAHQTAIPDQTAAARIAALTTLIDEDLGYQLHAAVAQTKLVLSAGETAAFHFAEAGLDLHASVTRADLERWISPELEAIRSAVDHLLESTNTTPEEVDRVFLTGGTSFVPAVRRIFEDRFTPARVTSGDAFTSVAQGLALSAAASG